VWLDSVPKANADETTGGGGGERDGEGKESINLEKLSTQFRFCRARSARTSSTLWLQPTFIIEARLEVGVTLSVELLTPDEFWAEDDAVVVV
jgi:hypothetical protein